jgi:transposase
MKKKGVYFRATTRQQRIVLFETYEASGSVKVACEKAHVSRRVFYDWKPRFDAEGYAGLEKPLSRAPHHSQKTSEAIEAKVIKLKKEHPEYGKRRIAHELAKENNWTPVISYNTVMRILKEHGLHPVAEPLKKS